jgi:hypothetical protein
MSKITLEITEVVNGLTINETPITLQGDLLAAASTSATAVSFTPAGGIAATNVQAALAELDSEKVSAAGGATAVTFNATGGIAATNVQTAIAELDTEKLAKSGGIIDGDLRLQGAAAQHYVLWDKSTTMLNFSDTAKLGFGYGGSGSHADLEIYHAGDESYIRDHGLGAIRIQTDGPGIYLGSNVNEAALSATFIPGGAVTINDTYRPRFTTNSTGSELNGQVNLVDATFPSAPTVAAGLNVAGLVEFDSLSGTGAVAITDILDADDMSGASATTLSTSESIKAYVDNQVAGKDNTDEITEGSTNLYFTNARADARIAAATTADLTEGSNLYFTNARADARIAAADTGDLSEGSNLYFTNARADARIAAATTTDLSEGSNLYFTNTRADARIANNIIDEDGFSTNSATRAPSQQSVKAYVAAQTANIQGDITNVQAGNGITGGGTSGAVTLGIDLDLVATAGNTLSLNNKTLNTPVINSPDINGGTVDGATVGAGTPSTGRFTSLFVVDDTPTFILNDSDGNEQFKISHQGGNSYISSFGSGTDFGATTIFRNNVTTGIDQKAVLKCSTNGDVRIFQDDGTTDLLKTDADQNRVGINTSSPAVDLDVVGTTASTQLNIRTGISLDSVATLSDDSSLTSWKLTDQSYYVGTSAGGPASNAGLQQSPTGFFVVNNDTSANAATINGFKAFLIGSSNNDGVDEYTLGSAYNIGNMTYVNRKTGLGDNSPQDLEVHNNGQYVFVLGNNNNRIRRFTLATAYNISTLSLATSGTDQIQDFSIPNTDVPTGFTFGGSGTDYGKKLYVVDSNQDTLQEFALATAFDISSNVTAVRSIDISDETKGNINSCTGVRFSADGTKVYLSDNAAGDDITRLNLSTPWDISTTTYHEAFYVGTVDLTISGIAIAGTEIYTVDTITDTIRQYTSDNTGVVLNADSLHIPGNLRVTDDITASGVMRVDGPFRATGGVQIAGTTITGALTLSSATATIRLGPENATGELTVGRSTKTHTVDIHNGVTEDGETATVNIGTSGASGSTTNINIGGGVGTCTTTIDADLVIPGETPASATAAGTQGQIAWDDDYIYICIATDTWKRAAIGTW